MVNNNFKTQTSCCLSLSLSFLNYGFTNGLLNYIFFFSILKMISIENPLNPCTQIISSGCVRQFYTRLLQSIKGFLLF